MNSLMSNIALKDQIVYDTDQYLKPVLNICPQSIAIKILQSIIKKCKYQIILKLQYNPQSVELKLKIISLQSYLKSRQRLNNFSSTYYKNLQCLTGIRINFEGNAEIEAIKIYHQIHQLLKKHPISMLQLSQSEFSVFHKYYRDLSYVQYNRFGKIYIFFYQIYNTVDIKEKIGKRQYTIIQEDLQNIQIPHKKGQLISLIHKNQQYFKQFFYKKKFLKYSHMKIQPNSIIFLSDQQNYQKIKYNTIQFLKSFSQQLQTLKIFKNQFQQQIFFMFYANKIKNVCLQRYKNQIAWKKLIYDPDQIDSQIKQLYHLMNKSLVFIPSSVQLRNLPKYMRLLYNPINTSINSLKYKIYQINNLFRVTVRNFGSIYQNQDTALFLIHHLQKCQEFCSILQENDIKPVQFKQQVKGKSGSKHPQYLTKKSKYFDKVIGWPINIVQKNANRVINDLSTLFRERFKDDKLIKIMIPQDSQQLIKYVFPLIFDELFSISNLHKDILMTIDIIVNFQQEKEINEHLLTFFKCLMNKSNKVKYFNPLYLNKFNIQKILQYKYVTCTLKHLQPRQKSLEDISINSDIKKDYFEELSTISSFLLYYELILNKKNIQRKIIVSTKFKRSSKSFDLLSIDKTNLSINSQFIIDMYSKRVISIIKDEIKQCRYDRLSTNLHKICKIITDYISNVDSLIIAANEDASIVNNEFYFIKLQQNGLYSRKMNKIIINMQKQTIIQEKNKQYQFDISLNHKKTRFLIEAAKKSKRQAKQLLNKANN